MIAKTGFSRPSDREIQSKDTVFEGFQYPVPVIPIDKHQLHIFPHLDEVAPPVLVAAFGENVFPGAREALRKRNIVLAEALGTQAQFDQNKTLTYGTGKSHRFNEHVTGGDRMYGWCATTLVANYLKIHDLPALRRFLEEVYKFDTEGGCRATMLAELVKIDNRVIEELKKLDAKYYSDKTVQLIFDLAEPAILAIIARESQLLAKVNLEKLPGELTLIEFFRIWLAAWEARNGSMESRVRSRLFELLHKSTKRKATHIPDPEDTAPQDRTYVTELGFIVEAMVRTKGVAKQGEIAEWLNIPFTMMYIDSTDFYDELDKQVTMDYPVVPVRALIGGKEKILLLSIVQSDSKNAHKAARYRRRIIQKDLPEDTKLSGLTVLANSAGNMQVFADEDLKFALLESKTDKRVGILEYAVAMARQLEELKSGRRLLAAFTSCYHEGEGPDGRWYYFKKGSMLLNASNTQAKLPTRISFGEMVRLLSHAFHPELVDAWCIETLTLKNV